MNGRDLTLLPAPVQSAARVLDSGEYQAIVLAAAGLKRLGLSARIASTFAASEMLPAAGQGALAIEVRSDRADLLQALAALAHQPTWLAVTAERAVSRAMGGSCSMPLAAFATWSGATLQIDAAWGEVEPGAGKGVIRAGASACVIDLPGAAALGTQVAQQLCAQGARPAQA